VNDDDDDDDENSVVDDRNSTLWSVGHWSVLES